MYVAEPVGNHVKLELRLEGQGKNSKDEQWAIRSQASVFGQRAVQRLNGCGLGYARLKI